MTEPPPPRYRVVERGRRLVVIDTRTGAAAGDPPRRAAPRWPMPQHIAFDGRATFETHPFYDARGPRTVTLDPTGTALAERLRTVAIGVAVGWTVLAVVFPWALLPLFALTDRRVRHRLRDAATRWLDRYAAGNGQSM